MSRPPLIASPEEIDAAWLTAVLRQSGYLVEVRSFRALDVGMGQVGRCVRFDLDVYPADDSIVESALAPRSLIGKFASADPLSRQAGVRYECYSKEVGFYRDLAPRVAVRTPRCYYADIVGVGPDHALMLEDMAAARQGDQLTGCSPAVARSAIRELAGLHATTWCDESLADLSWLSRLPAERAAENRATHRAVLPAFLERFGDRLEEDALDLIVRQADCLEALEEVDPMPFAVVHRDYRVDNLLIDDTTDPPIVTVVDWQTLTVGAPVNDLAYFLGASLKTELRRRHERELVEGYYGRLVDLGVPDFSWEDCWQAYVRGTFAGVTMAVRASMVVGETERGNVMFTAMARRHTRHALDLGADSLLR